MSSSTLRAPQRLAAVLAASTLAGGALVLGSAGLAPAADAAPAPATGFSNGAPGDGVWAPSHEEELAIIPICGGPFALLDWLVKNFSDHGSDIGTYLEVNGDHLRQAITNSSDPYKTLEWALQPFLQIIVYAVNDTVFHIPATLGDILTFCSSLRS